MTGSGIPLLFIHGLWIHSSAWSPWVEQFRAAGYDPIAPGWPGDSPSAAENRDQRDRLAGVGLNDIADHYGRIIESLPERPVVVGHSVGGLITQKLNVSHALRAAVAIDPAPIKGVRTLPLSQLRSAFPVLRRPGNAHRAISLTAQQFRYGFGNTLLPAESDELHAQYAIPGPGLPIFEVATANLRRRSPASVDTRTATRAPLLLVSGQQDHSVPDVVTTAVHRLYRRSPAVADLIHVAGRGHSLIFDHGWPDIAGQIEGWLDRQITKSSVHSQT